MCVHVCKYVQVCMGGRQGEGRMVREEGKERERHLIVFIFGNITLD